MRTTITPVDELDTEFLAHPPRPLFPNVQTSIGGQVTPPVTIGWIDDLGNQFKDDLDNDVVFEI